MTEEERGQRIDVYWMTSVQDLLRGVASGRPPMLGDNPRLPFPGIQLEVDQEPWCAPTSGSPSAIVHGTASLRSTTFHWTVRLSQIVRAILATM
jgi:hypothetical protein